MSKRAILSVTVAGRDISGALGKLLLSASVSLKADGEADTASFTMDDTNGVVVMPKVGDRIMVSIGWAGEGVRQVFAGTVDEPRSIGSRSGGRTLSFGAKGFDVVGKAKDGQTRHWDNARIDKILKDAAKSAGVQDVRVDPDLAKIVLKYFAMVDETFLHMGRRLAKKIGGHFRVQGDDAIMARRGASYSPSVMAAFGSNLHSWDVSPSIGRGQYGKIIATYYDRKSATWKKVEESTGLKSKATYTIKPACTDEADAKHQAKAMAETSKRDSGKGTVTIEGNTSAVPDGLCVIAGARPGVNGSYRIAAVTHSISRSEGWTTTIEINSPQGGAGEDRR